jgi:hypothetical protein
MSVERIVIRPTRRRHLVVVRAGARSCHRRWGYEQRERSWDLLVNVWDGTAEHGPHEYLSHAGTTKLAGVQEILAANPELLDAYETFFLIDDDIETTAEAIDRAFALFTEHALWVAQPALPAHSHANFVTHIVESRFLLRYVDHVEVMMPMFARDALRQCVDTFALTQSSWGIDWLWWPRLGRPRNRFAILDATPMHHTKPADETGGAFYRKLMAQGINARQEMEQLLTAHGLTLWQPTIFGGVVNPAMSRVARVRELLSPFGLQRMLYRAPLKPLRRALRAVRG